MWFWHISKHYLRPIVLALILRWDWEDPLFCDSFRPPKALKTDRSHITNQKFPKLPFSKNFMVLVFSVLQINCPVALSCRSFPPFLYLTVSSSPGWYWPVPGGYPVPSAASRILLYPTPPPAGPSINRQLVSCPYRQPVEEAETFLTSMCLSLLATVRLCLQSLKVLKNFRLTASNFLLLAPEQLPHNE